MTPAVRQVVLMGGRRLVSPPATYPWAPPVNVYRRGSGPTSVFTTNYDPLTTKARITPTTTIYVSLSSGNNNNTGLASNVPVRSLALALKMILDTGLPGKIIFESSQPGAARKVYTNRATQTRSGQATNNASWADSMGTTSPTVSLIWEADVAGGMADSWVIAAAGVWSATADPNIYVRTNGGAGNQPFDYTNLDLGNCPRRLTPLQTAPADTAAPWPEMNALWTLYSGLSDDGGAAYKTGVCYINGANLYARTFDNRLPDANIIVADTALAGSGITSGTATSAIIIWNDGLGFGGGSGAPFSFRSYTGVVNQNYNHNARFMGGNGAGAYAHTLFKSKVINYRCAGSYANLDGLNYHGSSLSDNTTCPDFVEIDCRADWNGWSTSGANNSSTCHEASYALRVNGFYLNAQNRSLHDINNSRPWDLGCTVSSRAGLDGTETSAGIAFGLPSANNVTVGWVDTCRIIPNAFGQMPQFRTIVYDSSTFNYANMAPVPSGYPAGATTGVYVSYTP